MEQRIVIKCRWEERHGSTQIHSKSVEHDEDKTLSYPDVIYWMRQFRMGRERTEDSRGSVRPPDFQTHFRIEGALEASPNASVRDIAQTTDIAPSTVFCVFTQARHLECRNRRWVPQKLTDDQRRRRVQLAVSLQAELEKAQRRNRMEFYTGDESWVLWENFPNECWLSLDEELPEGVRQTIGAEKSMLTVFQSEWFRYCGFDATRG
jgi:hypothetical protein